MIMITWEKVKERMKEKGLTSYYIRKNNIIGQATYNRIMKDQPIRTDTLDKLCKILDCKPEELITYRKDDKK